MIRIGTAPYLECSSKGERELSAFYARIRKYDYKSIEEIYQAAKIFEDGSTGLSWREAKGKQAINMQEVKELYSRLWDEYIDENPELIDVIKKYNGFSDKYGQSGHQCQAIEIYRIRQNIYIEEATEAMME